MGSMKELRQVEDSQPVDMVTEEKFLSVLMEKLIESHNRKVYEIDDVLAVFRALVASLREGVYSRHAKPIKETCKTLRIKNDRASIDALFSQTKD